MPSSNVRAAFGCDRDVHKEVDIIGNIPFFQCILECQQRLQKTLPAGVHMAFVEGIPNLVAFGRTRAAERIVPPTYISDDRHQDMTVC